MRLSPVRGALWRHPEFMRLWAGQSISLFGSQVSVLALPLTAVLLLHASPAQMGALVAMETTPFLLVGPFVGILVDRVPRRPLLLAADLGRGVLLAAIPVAALLGHLHLADLYLIAFLVGVLSVFFEVAYTAFLPALVSHDQLAEASRPQC